MVILRPKPRPCTAPVPPHAFHYGRTSNDGRSSRSDSPRSHRKHKIIEELYVDGAIHGKDCFLSNGLCVGGSAEIMGNAVIQNSTCTGDLDVTGELKVHGDARIYELNVDKDLIANDILVKGKADFESEIEAKKGMVVNKMMTRFLNAEDLKSDEANLTCLNVHNDATVHGSLNVDHKTSLYDTNINGNLNVQGKCVIEGSAEIKGKLKELSVQNETELHGNVTAHSNMCVCKTIKTNSFEACGVCTDVLESNTVEAKNLCVSDCAVCNDLCVKESLCVNGQMMLKSPVTFEKKVCIDEDALIKGSLCVDDVEIAHSARLHGSVEVADCLHCYKDIYTCGSIYSKYLETSSCVKSDALISQISLSKKPTCTFSFSTQPQGIFCNIICNSYAGLTFDLYLNNPDYEGAYKIKFNLGCAPRCVTHGISTLGFDCESALKQESFQSYSSSAKIQDEQLWASVELTKKPEQTAYGMVRLSLIFVWIGGM